MQRISALSRFAIFAFLLCLVGTLSACENSSPNGPSAQGKLTVFAASALTDAFKEIGQKFQEAHAGVTVSFTFGDSQTLAQQINQGTAADVFAPDNEAQMNVVIESGKVDASNRNILARTLLVVIFPKNNPAQITRLQDLTKPGLKIVLAAASLPAGQGAVDFLGKASADPTFGSGYKPSVLNNVVAYEQDVKTIINKVSQGQADAGIVYKTDAVANSSQLGQLSIPANLQTVATYLIAPVVGSKNANTAQQFVEYVLTAADPHEALIKYGFIPVENEGSLPGPVVAETSDLRKN